MTNTNRMKRLNWKLMFALPLAMATLASCDPDEDNGVDKSYPTENITLSKTQNVYVAELTAVDCGSCTPTREIMEVMKAQNPGRIVPISLHADTLYVEAADAVGAALGIDQSNPQLLFLNQVQVGVGVNPFEELNAMIEANLPPSIIVGHATKEVDSAWLVYPKVEFYTDLQGDYYIQSYILMSNIEAKSYGSIDLTQASGDPRISAGTNGAPTTWTADGGKVDSATFLFGPGDIYMHEDVLLAAGVNDTNVYGIPLSTISPLGAKYFIGDVFGTKYTPMEIVIPKPDFDMPAYLNADLKVVTIIWEKFAGSPDVYAYINGYYSEF